MRAARKTQPTKTQPKTKRSKAKTSKPDLAAAGEELTSSSGELASALGNRGAGVIESHHHLPGGHGPDPDGSEMTDAAGDLHSDERDIDDNDDAVDAAVETKADIEDIENLGGLRDEDEDVEESERSFLDERLPGSSLLEERRGQRHQSI